MKIRQLKVKVKSLAAEQRIIRHEEQKAHKSDLWNWRQHEADAMFSPHYWTHRKIYNLCMTRASLSNHRVHHVRPELRSSNIAYGLLKGRSLEQIERPRTERSLARKPYREPDWVRIAVLIKKYSDGQEVDLPEQLKPKLKKAA